MMEGIAGTVCLRVITKRKALHTMEPLDDIDRKILALLQTEGRLSGAEVGRRVGLSQPAASARILRLERQGVITGYRAIVVPAAIGLNIHAVVRLRTTHAHLGAAVSSSAQCRPSSFSPCRPASRSGPVLEVRKIVGAGMGWWVHTGGVFGPGSGACRTQPRHSSTTVPISAGCASVRLR